MTSPPIEGFSKLGIGPMRTRSQTERERRAQAQAQAGAGAGSQAHQQAHQQAQQPAAGSAGAAMASSSMNERIIRSGRFRYDISGLSEASRERFRDALECGKAISVEYCEETEEAGSYVFHVKDTFPIFVEKDEPQLDKPQSDEPHPSAPHCDCGMWEEGLACKVHPLFPRALSFDKLTNQSARLLARRPTCSGVWR